MTHEEALIELAVNPGIHPDGAWRHRLYLRAQQESGRTITPVLAEVDFPAVSRFSDGEAPETASHR